MTTWTSRVSSPGRQKAAASFLTLLGALPPDYLTTYRSEEVVADRDALGLLLRTRSQLIELVIWLSRDERRGLPSIHYVRNNMTKLRSLKIGVSGTVHQIYQGLVTGCSMNRFWKISKLTFVCLNNQTFFMDGICLRKHLYSSSIAVRSVICGHMTQQDVPYHLRVIITRMRWPMSTNTDALTTLTSRVGSLVIS